MTRAASAPGATYTVAFKSNTLPANVDKLIADAGGTIVLRLPQIGGLGVVSSSPTFAAKLSATASVAAAGSAAPSIVSGGNDSGDSWVRKNNRGQGDSRGKGNNNNGTDDGNAGRNNQPMPDQLGKEQWDKMRMNVSSTGSYRIERGRPSVHVALTDTGVDVTHPDIQPNLDVADSTSFVPYEPTIQDFNGHGTWTASAVGAPINRIGISGVAPNVSLVSLKTNDANGDGLLIWLDAALLYAADKRFEIVSSSIIAYRPTCKGADPAEECDNADYILAQRSVDYARDHGVTIVAALGNDNLDLADQERLKAAFGTTSEVVEALGGLNGVIGVSATGYANAKSFYSNYGLGVVDVAAPGGDTVFQPTPKRFRFGGALVGAWSSTAPPPSRFATDCVGAVCAPYAWMQGTSMAAPNAAGVAALIVSRYGRLSPARVEQVLEGTANAQSCPSPPTVTYPGFEDVFPYIDATCQGTPRLNGFFGAGIVDAVAALTLNR